MSLISGILILDIGLRIDELIRNPESEFQIPKSNLIILSAKNTPCRRRHAPAAWIHRITILIIQAGF
jgi:hypothetical protein